MTLVRLDVAIESCPDGWQVELACAGTALARLVIERCTACMYDHLSTLVDADP